MEYETLVQLIVWSAVLASLMTVAYYVISRVRGAAKEKEPTASQWLTKFRELYGRGALSDAEFRNIKTKLSEQLQEELTSDRETA